MVEREWQPFDRDRVSQILLGIAGDQRTGTFTAESGTLMKELHFDSGRLFSCASNNPSDFLAQRLVSRGVVSDEQRQKALEIKHHTQLSLGRILLILGAITEQHLIDAMASKLEDEVADLLKWQEGKWSFVEHAPASLQLVPLRVDVRSLLDRVKAPPPPAPIEEGWPEVIEFGDIGTAAKAPPRREEAAAPERAPSEAAVAVAEPEPEPEPQPEQVTETPVAASEEEVPVRSETAPSDMVVASANAKKYHRPSCKTAKKIAPDARLEFASEAEASARGLERCRVCFR
jgi:hypothetical protein